MTRQEAVRKVADIHGVDIDYGRNKDKAHEYRVFVASLEALGLIKFDEPKTESVLLADALRSAWCAAGQKDAAQGSIAIKEALANCGYQIVRKL